jgi:hypothetical protein
MYGISRAVKTRGHQIRINIERQPFSMARFHHLGHSIGGFFLSVRVHII